MNKRIPAKTIGEVVERIRALHIDVMVAKNPPSNDHSWGQPHDPEIRFKEPAHVEVDLLLMDALTILGQREVVEARKTVEESYDRFWYS